jgi:hypothetical protein
MAMQVPTNPTPGPASGTTGKRKRAATWTDEEWEDLVEFLLGIKPSSAGSCFTDSDYNKAALFFQKKYPVRWKDIDGCQVASLYNMVCKTLHYHLPLSKLIILTISID